VRIHACAVEKVKRGDTLAIGTMLRTMARIMRHVENADALLEEKCGLRRLVELFPGATPMRIPICVLVPRGKGQGLEEKTGIEYGTSRMVFFESRLPLEMDDKVHLRNSDGSLDADAIVVGLHFSEGRRAIAARFVSEVRNWILRG